MNFVFWTLSPEVTNIGPSNEKARRWLIEDSNQKSEILIPTAGGKHQLAV